MCATNKLANEVTGDLHQWRSQEAPLLGVVSALVELIKPLTNCLGLSESEQFDVIEGVDTLDLPPTNIHILGGDPFILLLNMDTGSGEAMEDVAVRFK
jgi:hypothetical protein